MWGAHYIKVARATSSELRQRPFWVPSKLCHRVLHLTVGRVGVEVLMWLDDLLCPSFSCFSFHAQIKKLWWSIVLWVCTVHTLYILPISFSYITNFFIYTTLLVKYFLSNLKNIKINEDDDILDDVFFLK